jgi:glutaminyl-peptide cyclotransferase
MNGTTGAGGEYRIAMRTLRVLILAAPILAGCNGAGASGGGTALDGPQTPAPPFNADTAFSYIAKQVSFGPRVPGMPGHAAQLEWMTQFLRARADTVILQPFEHVTTTTGKRLEMTNVYARFRPDLRDHVLLITHWDTRPTADEESSPDRRAQPIPGANDGGSGTAVLLELANVLSSNSPPIGVDLLFVDGEDYGPGEPDMYLGAKHFAATETAYHPLYGILLDMVGDANPVFPIEGNSKDSAPEVVDRVWRTAEQLGYGSAFPRRDGGWITDDHIPLNRAGIRTIDIIDFDYPYWHRLSDDLSNVAPKGLGIVGSVMTALIYRGG